MTLSFVLLFLGSLLGSIVQPASFL